MITVTLFGLLIISQHVQGRRTVIYDLPGSHCGASRSKVDAVLLRSSSNPLYANSACTMKFDADDSLFSAGRFVLGVRRFNITSCNVVLKLYWQHDYRVSAPDLTLDCHSAAPPAVIDTHSRQVTVVLEKVALSGYQFELVLTAYRTGTSCHKEFLCANRRCIDKDLFCDQVDNCLDGSDENCPISISGSGGYSPPHYTSTRHVRLGPLIGLLAAGATGLLLCCLLGFLCCRRRRAMQGHVISLAPRGHVISSQPITEATAALPPSYYAAGYSTDAQNYPAAQPGAQYPPQQYPPQQYPPQQYPPQPYPPQPYPTQPYPGAQQYPSEQYPPQQYPPQYQLQ